MSEVRLQMERRNVTDKPPYSVPTMDQVRSIPWNGLTVASTFSGAGGSCTGYRMAGYRVVWANEFVPAAQASYKANASEHCTLDCRDIKLVLAEDIFKATGLKQGELDLFDGSPPCQAFSTAGKREKGWGKKKSYEHGATQCNEQLFTQYIRLLRDLQPRVFVAENVSGLVKGTAKGFFLEILRDLKACGYQVKCKVLDAKWLGVPQSRTRTIFVGVRNDLSAEPVHPSPLRYLYSVRDALPEIMQDTTAADSDTRMAPCYQAEWPAMKPGEASRKYFSLVKVAPDRPSPTVDTSAKRASVCHPATRRKFTIAELRRICAFPDDFILKGTYAQQWERLGNSVPPVMMQHIAAEIRDKVLRP